MSVEREKLITFFTDGVKTLVEGILTRTDSASKRRCNVCGTRARKRDAVVAHRYAMA